MKIDKHISGDLLKAARILTGQSHKYVVHKLDISASTLINLERNGVRYRPSVTRPSAIRLLKFFDDQGIGFTKVDGRVCGVFRNETPHCLSELQREVISNR